MSARFDSSFNFYPYMSIRLSPSNIIRGICVADPIFFFGGGGWGDGFQSLFSIWILCRTLGIVSLRAAGFFFPSILRFQITLDQQH